MILVFVFSIERVIISIRWAVNILWTCIYNVFNEKRVLNIIMYNTLSIFPRTYSPIFYRSRSFLSTIRDSILSILYVFIFIRFFSIYFPTIRWLYMYLHAHYCFQLYTSRATSPQRANNVNRTLQAMSSCYWRVPLLRAYLNITILFPFD